jgi:8-oxo-dGTP diphosphatase
LHANKEKRRIIRLIVGKFYIDDFLGGFMDKEKFSIFVTCAIVEKDGKFLVTQRPDDGRSNAGRWEFPGGTLEWGEDPRTSLKREIQEEMGIDVNVGEIFEISTNVYGEKKHVILLGFHCKYESGEIEKKDIADFKWVSPDEMKEMDITEADLPFIEKL